MKKFIILISFLSILFSCKSKTAVEKVEEKPHVETQENMVSLTYEQIEAAEIELGTIEVKNLTKSIKANGMLSVPNQNKAFVTSVNSGVVKSLLIQPGSFVRKGQVIATIINPDVARLQQELQITNAQISMNEIELRRQQDLVKGNAAPLKNVQRVQTELATLRATKKSLQNQLSAMGISYSSVNRGNIVTIISIYAPISGTISTVTAQIGSNLDPSTPIAEIVNNSQLHLDLFVYEKDLPILRSNQTIHFTLTNNPGREYDAQIYSIGTAFANESKSIPVHAIVKGDKTGLIEGMSITAVISIGEALLPSVPSAAIVSHEGQDFIFIVSDKQQASHSAEKEVPYNEESLNEDDHKENVGLTFERIQVIKGVSDVGYTEIKPVKELPSHAKIVTKGAFFVLAKMTSPGEDEHGH